MNVNLVFLLDDLKQTIFMAQTQGFSNIKNPPLLCTNFTDIE